jgi:hypothetical protein
MFCVLGRSGSAGVALACTGGSGERGLLFGGVLGGGGRARVRVYLSRRWAGRARAAAAAEACR